MPEPDPVQINTNGLEPYDYLRRVYTDLPRAQTVGEIEALLPWNLQSATEADLPNEPKGEVT
ncbi:transposase domain-containing protein [Microbulbifer sp. 2304DJ12-6]|uniref:transposase domain-containing protein n=1 Tax=Microbulbifer sp. 2304DJ12-6 TaxID=3233340 RepID=UPI0039B0908A